MEKVYIDKRAVELARYIITTKDTVRGAAKKFGVSKSTVHMEVTLRNGYTSVNIIPDSHDKNESKCVAEHTHETVSAGADYGQAVMSDSELQIGYAQHSLSVQSSVLYIPESIAIKKVFLAEKNPIVKLGLIVK